MSCLRKPLPLFHYMIAGFGGMDVRCAEYATFGSDELAESIIAAMENRSACLMANHGMVVFGSDIRAALRKAETLEMLARQYLICLSVGDPVLLNDEIANITARYKTYGQQKENA
ncbi:MAG: hypothetical protein DWQ08_07405 [Proteobacteria bacterium]|nr:MAG: hypothetical protein DWQ08_07405 [Pseudomonadota bacterium]